MPILGHAEAVIFMRNMHCKVLTKSMTENFINNTSRIRPTQKSSEIVLVSLLALVASY
ncbi:unnamed protein product [Amoebophrya sp. A120]|nr:unnamed protein product [Amoebophrya sp. A120]|eukprot:GSA120T00009224001.1